MSEITDRGEALVESGLSPRHAHELNTGCTAEQLCDRCLCDIAVSLVPQLRSQLDAMGDAPGTDKLFDLAGWAVAALPGMLASMEALMRFQQAAQRPSLGYIVARIPADPEDGPPSFAERVYARKPAAREVADERNLRANHARYVVAEVREVQP